MSIFPKSDATCSTIASASARTPWSARYCSARTPAARRSATTVAALSFSWWNAMATSAPEAASRSALAAPTHDCRLSRAPPIRTIFAQPKADMVRDQLDAIATMLGRQSTKVETMLRDAAVDLLAFTSFPPAHWKKIWSTNPLERLNKEVKRRTDVVGVFPNPDALLRLAGAVLVEAHDEWQTGDRRYLSEATMALLTTPHRRKEWPHPNS
jgi:hypothetical protein